MSWRAQSNKATDNEIKVEVNWGKTNEVTPAWHRLWQLLLSPGLGPTVKGGIRHEQFTGVQQDAEETGEAEPQDYFQ